MNSQTSRSIIVAGGMGVVVAIGVAAFALRSHHPVALTPLAATSAAHVPDEDALPPAVSPEVPSALGQIDVPSTPSSAVLSR
jgi:hypothetical protein